MTTLDSRPGVNGHPHPLPHEPARERTEERADGTDGGWVYDHPDQPDPAAAAPLPYGWNSAAGAAAEHAAGSTHGTHNGSTNGSATGDTAGALVPSSEAAHDGSGGSGLDLDEALREAARKVALAREHLPARDPAMFDCFLGGLVGAVAETTEADPIAILASLIAATGVQVGPRPHVQVGDDRQPLLVWPLVIGRTGDGRKGASWSSARRIIRAADPEFAANNIRSGLTSGEGLAAVFAAPTGDRHGSRGSGTGSGSQGAGVLPEGDRRLLVFEPEWAAVMARMRREGNSLSATLRAAWEGGDLSTLTVTARIARTSHVGLIAHISPKEFQARVSAADMAGGTYNRFLPFLIAQSKFLPLAAGADPELVEQLGAALATRANRASEIGTVGFTTAGAQLWQRLYVEFGTDPSDDAAGAVEEFTARIAPNCLRIAALHTVLDGHDRMDVGHLTAAAALVRYSLASARAVLTNGPDLGRLAAWIADAGPAGRTREEIRRDFFRGNADSKRITTALEELARTGRITAASRPNPTGKGRRAAVFTAPTAPIST